MYLAPGIAETLIPISLVANVVLGVGFFIITRNKKSMKRKPEEADSIFVRDAIKVVTVLGEDYDASGDWYYNDGRIIISYNQRKFIPIVRLGAVDVFDIDGFKPVLHLEGQFELRKYMAMLFAKAVAKEADDQEMMRDSMNTALDSIKESMK